MAGRKLAAFVHVHDAEGNSHVFGPDDLVPERFAKLITNPAAWAAEPEPEVDLDGEPSESWTVAQLRAYADQYGVELGEATKKADILAVLAAGDGNA
ncbi:hypothetical protein [Micromonospora sp. NPDC048169]|uniref:hypothetical protein n=1 Tax=Micromonospora sp. NPDC048169 TaxID=3154711 RepID=UPI0033D91AAA